MPVLSCIPSSRALLHITLSILFLGVALVASRPTQNITIEVPSGTTNHGDPSSFCTPTTWIDIASYLLLNYVAHGATVVSYPGEPAFDTLLYVGAAILFPSFGVIRAFNFIVRHPVLSAKTDLEVARRSGALCMLVRSSSWKPQQGDKIRNGLIEDPGDSESNHWDPCTDGSPINATMSMYTPPWLQDRTRFWSYLDTGSVEIGSRVVFGSSKPPDQYSFAFVPRNTEVLGLADPIPTSSSNVLDKSLFRSLYRIFASPDSTPKLSSSFNLVKGMVALLQLIYASSTLYRTSGGQVKQYGFAAPGLTVLPYAVMSALNLVANLLAPHYPTMYLVRSEVMEEAERRTGLSFQYVVGKVVDEESDTNNIVKEDWSEIEGSFKVDDKLLYVPPSEEEDEKIVICDHCDDADELSSDQTIYIPTCPRFRRTDYTWTSPLRQFVESPQRRLEFPRYQSVPQGQLAFTQPSFLQRFEQFAFSDGDPMTVYEILVIAVIVVAELLFILTLSRSSGQQSTVAQRAWTIAWLVAGYSIGGTMSSCRYLISDEGGIDVSPVLFRSVFCFLMVIFGAPAIGGFVVVSQMLKAYGICYRFV